MHVYLLQFHHPLLPVSGKMVKLVCGEIKIKQGMGMLTSSTCINYNILTLIGGITDVAQSVQLVIPHKEDSHRDGSALSPADLQTTD